MYEVIFTRRARKSMSRFSRREYERVLRAIERLAENPKPTGARKMRGTGSLEEWRIRVGDYRIVYRIEEYALDEDQNEEDFAGRVIVLVVGHRGSVYG